MSLLPVTCRVERFFPMTMNTDALVKWQQAVNCQPGYRSGNSKGRSPSRYYFPGNSKFSKNLIIFQLFKKVWLLQNSEILKSFSNFNTISINFNMFFTTILIIHKHFQNAMTFRNNFFMVKSTVVQPPLLARLATVSVLWQTSGKPATKCPLGELVDCPIIILQLFFCSPLH